MNNWINVNDRLPDVEDCAVTSWKQSKILPVMVEGHEGWQRGYLMDHKDGSPYWKIEGWHGDFNITHWYDMPEVVDTLPSNSQDLQCWFGLDRASWLTLPRVLLESMPDAWQGKLAVLLNQYDDMYPNLPELNTVVQVTEPGGRMIKTPVELIDYRRPYHDAINRWKGLNE